LNDRASSLTIYLAAHSGVMHAVSADGSPS
jgi:hypothetical protein